MCAGTGQIGNRRPGTGEGSQRSRRHRRPQAVRERVDFAVGKICAPGKVAGTLVTSVVLPFWLERDVRYFYVHSDPFVRLGLANVRKILGR
jgi:hypothetical protein